MRVLYSACHRRGVASRLGIARLVSMRCVDSPRMRLLNTTIVTNGLLREQIQCCHGWWRQIQRRFWAVSYLSAVDLCISFRECVRCVLRATFVVVLLMSRHCASLVCARMRCVDSTRMRVPNTTSINGTMATNDLLREQIQSCHDWWRLYQQRFWSVSRLFAVDSSVDCLFRQRVSCVLCATSVVVLLHGTALCV